MTAKDLLALVVVACLASIWLWLLYHAFQFHWVAGALVLMFGLVLILSDETDDHP